ncbi:hypothetical protein Pla52o_55160 [Novipirellula galeiformis]|uniref:Uncharacterized protein n=1 Tax=Novipirellula galeiformis TaxID=2528004 RepID=A0A5C6BWE4_9BACT|nr:hypothetical protein [Novipirellula galeiformis]TWU14979.1 hypothetical protein Pla52o_55160 [Novipirellula galeiformis]
MVPLSKPIYRYCVDQKDVIVCINDWWLAFAKENHSAELNELTVVGKSLWEFIVDEPTRTLYKEIHNWVRMSGTPITIPFRCDSPVLQRYMQLTINRAANGGLRYESALIRALPQRHLSVFEPSQPRTKAFLTMCSFCKRTLIEPSGWLEMENIAIKLQMYETQTVPGLHYTVCPECASQFQQEQLQPN